jgi:hypothetical protein
MKFEVIDDDGGGRFDIIGSFETNLGNIMGARSQTIITDLKLAGNDKSRGKIIIRADSLKDSNWDV